MPTQAIFLDTGVVIGYCFTLDDHHYNCQEYIEDNAESDLFVSNRVEAEYRHAKHEVSKRLANAVRQHIQDIMKDDCEGQLGPMDISHLKRDVLHRSNDARMFLAEYYDSEVGNFIDKDVLLQNLRSMAREIESFPLERKEDLDERLHVWERTEDHTSVDSALSMIHREDRHICIDAHDLACTRDCPTEFGTVNPRDFIDGGRRETILSVTEIDSIRDLAARS